MPNQFGIYVHAVVVLVDLFLVNIVQCKIACSVAKIVVRDDEMAFFYIYRSRKLRLVGAFHLINSTCI